MEATKAQIGARVDALAHAHEGRAFVDAVRRLADELGDERRPLLEQVLLERAADEEDFRKAVQRRFAEKGWMRRTLARFERAWQQSRADEIADAVEAGPDGAAALAAELELMRAGRGKAALALDELSRHENPHVRAWAAVAAADVLGEGGIRLVLSLTRDRDAGVREQAVAALVALDREAARAIVPDVRRRLQSADVRERIAAAWVLAELGDRHSLPVLAERAEMSVDPEEQIAARAAALVLAEDDRTIAAELRAAGAEDAAALAAAARILGAPEALAALAELAESAADDAVRAACRAELEKRAADS